MYRGHRPHHHQDIDLGNEPPLLTDGPAGPFDRRQVSLRWLTGTVLTGMTSGFLMGGALFVALDGRQILAATPAELTTSLKPGGDTELASALDIRGGTSKGDRLRTGPEPAGARQVLNLSTLTKVGDKDIVRIKPFVRIATALTMKQGAATANMPAFDPLKVFANTDLLSGRTSNIRNPAFYDYAVEGDIALKTKDLPLDSTTFDVEAIMTATEVERIVRDQARFLTDGSVQVAALPTADMGRIEATFGTPGLDSAMALRITAENVSFFSKSDTDKASGPASGSVNEKIVTVGANDSLKSILKDNQADDKLAGDIIRALGKMFDLKTFDAGMKVRIGLAKVDLTEKLKPVRVSIYNAKGHVATVALSDSDEEGTFVAAQEPDINDAATAEADDDESIPDPNAAPSLYHSLYQTALDNQVPSDMIKELVQIYSYDVDFNQRVRQGDTFELFYSMADPNDRDAKSEILYTAINIKGQPKRFYRYRSPDDGTVDYYDEQGKSAKKFLMRKPMEGGALRSGFGGRVHPILGYYRFHSGVDWANPPGTPILASGNGTVTFAGWKSGYGRYTRIQHANGYETGYGHQSGFAKNLVAGAKVHQGQVIGYVGSTGQSTGPHLHYEVLINGAFVDPMRVRLPRGKELTGPMLAEFQKERERVDTMMTKSTSPVAKVAQGN